MITLKIDGVETPIPATWNDITYKKYCEILLGRDKSFAERMAIYTGIDSKTISALNLDAFGKLCALVSFCDEPDRVEYLCPPYGSDLSIELESYEKLELSKQNIAAAENAFCAGAEIIKIYTGDDISDQPITKCYNRVTFFLSSLKPLMSGSKD